MNFHSFEFPLFHANHDPIHFFFFHPFIFLRKWKRSYLHVSRMRDRMNDIARTRFHVEIKIVERLSRKFLDSTSLKLTTPTAAFLALILPPQVFLSDRVLRHAVGRTRRNQTAYNYTALCPQYRPIGALPFRVKRVCLCQKYLPREYQRKEKWIRSKIRRNRFAPSCSCVWSRTRQYLNQNLIWFLVKRSWREFEISKVEANSVHEIVCDKLFIWLKKTSNTLVLLMIRKFYF